MGALGWSVYAVYILHETLTIIQIISGGVLVFGCWIVTRLAKKALLDHKTAEERGCSEKHIVIEAR